MKTFIRGILCLGLLAAVPASAAATGLKTGTQMFSVFVGSSSPTNRSSVYYNDISEDNFGREKLEWAGDSAFLYGAQYLVELGPYFAIGVEGSGNNFGKDNLERLTMSGLRDWTKGQITSYMDVYSLMLAARLSTSAQLPVRFYIPFGFGWAYATQTFELEETGMTGGTPYSRSRSDRDTQQSVTYYVGVGLEMDLAEHWLLGFEMRYQAFGFEYGDMNPAWDKKTLGFLSGLIRVGYKF